MPLKHVLSVMGHVKFAQNPKQWAIAHKNGHKRKNNEFFGHAYQTSTKCHGLENHPENPKLWTIAHKNGPKI
jgi:hypothetical protein